VYEGWHSESTALGQGITRQMSPSSCIGRRKDGKDDEMWDADRDARFFRNRPTSTLSLHIPYLYS